MLFYLIVKYVCWLWGVVPDDITISLFSMVSFGETVFEIWFFVDLIDILYQRHKRNAKERM